MIHECDKYKEMFKDDNYATVAIFKDCDIWVYFTMGVLNTIIYCPYCGEKLD